MLLGVTMAWLGIQASEAGAYLNHQQLTARVRALAAAHPDLVRVESLARSLGGRDVWRLELGSVADVSNTNRPAMLVLAGAEGNDLVGSSVVLGWAEALISGASTNAATRELLSRVAIHVIPRLNADAAETFFEQPRSERSTTNRAEDDDRDGLIDEDGPEDINGDGRVTSMRVQDPEGDYILDATDPRVLIKADRSKGERGAWRLLTEGIDNDKDEAWNEDGVGGVNLNRNFPYGFKFFERGAGRHPVSEIETRALADFVVSHPSIAVVFAFGASDNLSQPPKSEPGGKRPPGALHEGDLPILKELGKGWRDAIGLKKELPGATEPGTVVDWGYFHRGRLALAARPWTPAMQIEWSKAAKEQEKSAKDDKAPKDEKAAKDEKPAVPAKPEAGKPAPDSRSEDERAWLKWVDENAPDAFVAWKEFNHPDFPGKTVEIGGHAPFARTNPPEKQLDDLTEREGKFLTDLAGKLPRIAFRKTEARSLGEGVFELRIQVENNGYLPTVIAQGGVSGEVHPTRLIVHLDEKAFLSGAPRTRLGNLEGSGGVVETRLTVRLKDVKSVSIEAISMLGGSVATTLELPEAR